MAKQFNFEVIPLPDVPLGVTSYDVHSAPSSILIVDDEP